MPRKAFVKYPHCFSGQSVKLPQPTVGKTRDQPEPTRDSGLLEQDPVAHLRNSAPVGRLRTGVMSWLLILTYKPGSCAVSDDMVKKGLHYHKIHETRKDAPTKMAKLHCMGVDKQRSQGQSQILAKIQMDLETTFPVCAVLPT